MERARYTASEYGHSNKMNDKMNRRHDVTRRVFRLCQRRSAIMTETLLHKHRSEIITRCLVLSMQVAQPLVSMVNIVYRFHVRSSFVLERILYVCTCCDHATKKRDKSKHTSSLSCIGTHQRCCPYIDHVLADQQLTRRWHGGYPRHNCAKTLQKFSTIENGENSRLPEPCCYGKQLAGFKRLCSCERQ